MIARLMEMAYNIYYSWKVLFDQEKAMLLDQTISNSQISLIRIDTPILVKKTIDQNKVLSTCAHPKDGCFIFAMDT